MDYKYIEQLLERYWRCETTLEEERILRAFFAQKDLPAALLPYKDLFAYAQLQANEVALGDDFDAKILNIVGADQPVKARMITTRQRLLPLFKAAAIVAIILTLGNAIQGAFNEPEPTLQKPMAAEITKQKDGVSVAKADSVHNDSVARRTMQLQEPNFIK